MAACCTSVGVSGKFCLKVPSNVRPQPSPPVPFRCCSTQVSQRRSSGSSLLRRPVSTKVSSAPGRRRTSWGQERPILQRQKTESASSPTSCCLPTNVSSSDVEQNVVEGSGTGMSIGERDAIIAFEEGNSSEYLQSSSEDEEPKASQAMEKSEEDVAVTERQQEMCETLDAVKGQGATIANIITLFVPLLDRHSPGDGRMLAATGSAVLERVEEEVGKLQAVDGMDGQSLFEILRAVKLLRMEIQLVAAARKDGTLSERLEQTKAHCRQLLSIASTL